MFGHDEIVTEKNIFLYKIYELNEKKKKKKIIISELRTHISGYKQPEHMHIVYNINVYME